jgi:two-component system, sensor histidine kinase and response regulator
MLKKKVLIIDDEKDFLEELKETLALSGYDTISFDNGDDGLNMAEKINPDVILLDLKMDNKSGFEIADELKNNPQTADIPIIAMTGFYTEHEHTKLINIFGIRTCLIKPFNPLDIIVKIEEALDKKIGQQH